MNPVKSDYFDAYRSLKLTRDASGVLVAKFYSNGGPFIMSAPAHTELVKTAIDGKFPKFSTMEISEDPFCSHSSPRAT